jgi:hypothetical protein
LAGSTTKKALIRRFDREPLPGFLNPHQYLQPHGVEMLTPSGTVISVNYGEIKSVCFVKDFDSEPDSAKVFQSRPKMEGLWVRMNFRDGDVMDGILPNNLLLWDRYGYSVIPPEPYSNNQKVFVPRDALTDISVLGVVGSPLTKGLRRKPVPKEQIGLFE